MSTPTFTIALPIAERRRAHDFYVHALGLTAVGPIADDGIPEPLQFVLGDTNIMLVPPGGLGWAIGERRLRERDVVGCVLTIHATDASEVDALAERAVEAGAEMIVAPTTMPWGMHAATFTDPDGAVWMVSTTPG